MSSLEFLNSDTESRMVGSGGWGNGEFLFNKYRVQLGKVNKFWRWMVNNNVNAPNGTKLHP